MKAELLNFKFDRSILLTKNKNVFLPTRYENSVRVKDSVLTDVTRYDVASEDGRIVRVRVFAPLTLSHGFPAVIEYVLGGPDLHRD